MSRRASASDAGAIEHAAALIREGRLVAFPTETVYGLGARADDREAVLRIFAAKGRPPTNPLIVHVPDAECARALASAWPEAARALAAAFWPGPLTLVVKRRAGEGAIVDACTAGGPTAALRVPSHPIALGLLHAAGVPIAAPSANRSTAISPTTAEHVLKSLGDAVDLVLDGGPTGDPAAVSAFGIESTIVDVTRDPAVLLRPGAIPLASLRAHAEVVDRGAQIVAEGERATAPGAQARHYAPSARVVLLGEPSLAEEVEVHRARGERVGVIVRARARAPESITGAHVEVLPADPKGYAAALYAALHRLEDARCEVIVIAEVPADAAWLAVRDRLRRAAA